MPAGGGALLGERMTGGALLGCRPMGGALLSDAAAGDTLGAETAVTPLCSSSGANTGAMCMTALVRAERIAARTMSRRRFTSTWSGCTRSCGSVRNVPTSVSSSKRTTL
jgi:hypothetical protein